MKLIRAKLAGFCPGVKIAWQKVKEACKTGPVFVLGDLLHNYQAIQKLEELGAVTIHDFKKLSSGSRVVIRAHGEPKETYEKLKKLKDEIIDATCFRVKKVQKEAKRLEKEDYQVIVCGEENHPEVKATIGHTKEGIAINSKKEAERLNLEGRVALLSQTTFSFKKFQEIKRVLEKKKGINLKVLGTICDFTQAAQKEARDLGKRVDCLIIVGGKRSSNTRRLKEIGSKICPTYHVETAEELNPDWFSQRRTAGLLAGASTPDWVINEVERKLKEY